MYHSVFSQHPVSHQLFFALPVFVILFIMAASSQATEAPRVIRSVPSAISPIAHSRRINNDVNPVFDQIDDIRPLLPIITVSRNQAQIDAQQNAATTNPPTIGIPIDLPELNTDDAVQRVFAHYTLPNNEQLFGIRIDATAAVGVRLGLLIDELPDTAQIAFFDSEAATPIAPPRTGADINHLIQLNQAGGDTSTASRTYWSPTILGEQAIVFIYLPADVHSDAIRIHIPQLSYLFQNPVSSVRAAASCHLDVSCYSDWSSAASAVASIIFTENGSSVICTGALLNDTDDSSFIPYFLTANHCINTQTVASTLETYWFYQSNGCDSSITDSRYTYQSGGAQLLYNNSETDTAFMQLNTQPPEGITYLGWTNAELTIGDQVTGIHHPFSSWRTLPYSDLKKISFGQISDYLNCTSSLDYYNCLPSTTANADHIQVIWSGGVTATGSSGSPLLNVNSQVVGQLHGGTSSCYYSNSPDEYGRFDTAYYAALYQWLDSDGAPPVTPVLPAIPLNVFASDGSYTGKVRVSWEAVNSATSYQVFRCTSSSINTCGNGYVTSNSTYDDYSARIRTRYYYRVKACNTAGCSDYSDYNTGYKRLRLWFF
ncbi:trypsin-like peptidase domain-containing protein [Rhodopseudomonas palustris]|uniref:Trypsin-like peptidase domain-containing protein n=1 Tax=Thiospirillum jenense TaxID=1653858 RepID=A0A839HGL4_9GAMM|nr:trypsin-like peptidase domain-containing protein [Thiospirillum jenense]MBB1093057.1 trypsin-like peptidase domain-containing protein [Rhodopseudomonas palustris]MBB1127130.1 trypsin-like peptidase domain-containing protein [Thiospirillum jenense]